jgi:mono/diheme cytochrome c family protein
MTITRHLAIGVAASALLLCAQSAQAVPNAGTIEGVVKNAAGQPVTGAYVKLKNTDGRLTFLVASQAGGKFTAGDLPPGQYTIQGIGGGFTSAVSQPLTLDANKTAKAADISLANKQGPVLAGAWPGRLPEEEHAKVSLTLPAGAGKALVEEKCTACHTDNRIVVKRSDANDWAFTIRRMRINLAAAGMPDLSEQDASTITKYLADNFKPLAGHDENARFPRTLAAGDATKFRVVTYNLPRPYSEPHDIAVDPTGVAWAAERAGMLIRFDPKNLEFTERPIPAGIAAPDRQRLGNPQIDAKGILWTADGPNNRWLSYDTVNRQYKSYPWTEKGTAMRAQQHGDSSEWTDLRHRLGQRSPHAGSDDGRVEVLRIALLQGQQRQGARRLRSCGGRRRCRVVRAERCRPDGAHRSENGKGRRVQDPV